MLTMCGCCGMGILLVGILGDKLRGCLECRGMCNSLEACLFVVSLGYSVTNICSCVYLCVILSVWTWLCVGCFEIGDLYLCGGLRSCLVGFLGYCVIGMFGILSRWS